MSEQQGPWKHGSREGGTGAPHASLGDGTKAGIEAVDLDEQLRASIKDLHAYDEHAIDCYAAFSFYIAQRQADVPQAQAAQMTCEAWGHEAPRGLCLRCGLGVELGGGEDKRAKERVSERARWLSEIDGRVGDRLGKP